MTNRRDFIVKLTMAGGAISFLQSLNIFAGIGAKLPSTSGAGMLTILHTANINGQLYALEKNEKMFGLGGLQNIASKIADIKKETASVLVIDAGNMIGNQLLKRDDSLIFNNILGDIGYDVVVPGQNDLAEEATCFSQLVKKTKLNIISYNNKLNINAAELPYSIIKRGVSRIGIINAGIAALKASHNTSALHAAAAMNQTARLLRELKNCTLIICIVQSSAPGCSKLAGLSSGIDVMISAAERTPIHNTQIALNKLNHEVILSYAGARGTMISRIDLKFNDKREKLNVASKAIFTGAEGESYAAILKRCTVYNT